MTNKSKTKKLEDTSITLAEAMDRTNFWRQAVKPLFKDKMHLVPKAFFIPFEDIKALADKYSAYDTVGVRAYFTILQPEFKEGVRAVLVPVTQEVAADGVTVIYKDLIINPTNDPTGDDTASSSIYDFTKPCPDSCDINSPLC